MSKCCWEAMMPCSLGLRDEGERVVLGLLYLPEITEEVLKAVRCL